MTHLTSPAQARGAPSSPPADAGGEDIRRRSFLAGAASLPAALLLGGCIGRPYYHENPAQKAFLDGLQTLARPALSSSNPLQVEEAATQSLALSNKVGAFTDWQGILRIVEGNAQNVAVTIEIGPQVSLYAFNDWTLGVVSSVTDFFSRSRNAPPPGLSDPAVAALKTLKLGQRVALSGRMGEIAGSGLFDLSRFLGKTDAEHRQFLQAPRFVARIDTLLVPKPKK